MEDISIELSLEDIEEILELIGLDGIAENCSYKITRYPLSGGMEDVWLWKPGILLAKVSEYRLPYVYYTDCVYIPLCKIYKIIISRVKTFSELSIIKTDIDNYYKEGLELGGVKELLLSKCSDLLGL